jgi:hypothetical protein
MKNGHMSPQKVHKPLVTNSKNTEVDEMMNKEFKRSWVLVVHACNPSYLGVSMFENCK